MTLVVHVPEKLTKEQREALQAFDDAMRGIKPDDDKPKKKGLFK